VPCRCCQGTSLQSEASVQKSKQKELYIIDFIQAQELKSLTHQNYNQNIKNTHQTKTKTKHRLTTE